MKEAFLDVCEFERLCGHELPGDEFDKYNPPNELLLLRHKLIDEESGETLDALEWAQDSNFQRDNLSDEQLAAIADGLADTIFVCIGTAIRLGIDLPEVWRRVCEANLKKFGPGSHVREDGKRLKPPSWTPPDILGVIKNQKTLHELYSHELNKETNG